MIGTTQLGPTNWNALLKSKHWSFLKNPLFFNTKTQGFFCNFELVFLERRHEKSLSLLYFSCILLVWKLCRIDNTCSIQGHFRHFIFRSPFPTTLSPTKTRTYYPNGFLTDTSDMSETVTELWIMCMGPPHTSNAGAHNPPKLVNLYQLGLVMGPKSVHEFHTLMLIQRLTYRQFNLWTLTND